MCLRPPLFFPPQSPQNATAFDATSPVSKTPNLTPVVRKETMVDPPTSRDLKYQCISETPVRRREEREGGGEGKWEDIGDGRDGREGERGTLVLSFNAVLLFRIISLCSFLFLRAGGMSFRRSGGGQL